MGDQDGLAIGFEEHEVGFPMSWKARPLAASGRWAMETRPLMELADDPPLRPRQPRLVWPWEDSAARSRRWCGGSGHR